MTLHALRLTVGDDDFFRILRRWAQPAGGRQRHDRRSSSPWPSGSRARTWTTFFQTWLFTPGKPVSLPQATATATALAASVAANVRHAPAAAVASAEVRPGFEAGLTDAPTCRAARGSRRGGARSSSPSHSRQLTHWRRNWFHLWSDHRAPPERIELPTYGVETRCSIR